MQELETIWLASLTAISSFAAWWLKMLYNKLDDLENDVARMPEKYVLKIDYRNDMSLIHGKLDKIIDKLDAKVDK